MAICIIGIGNELRGDDSIGVKILENLKKLNCPGVDLYNIENRIFELPDTIKEYQCVLIIDALPPDNEPGKMVMVKIDTLNLSTKNFYSIHDLNLLWQLQFAHQCGYKGKIYILGIEGAKMDYHIGLSSEIVEKLPELIKKVMQIVKEVR